MKLSHAYYRLCATPWGHRAARLALNTLRRFGWRREFHTPLDALFLDHAACAGLMRLWQRVHWSSGDGMMPPGQLLAIYRLAASWPVSGDIVELGSWVGLTTSYLATACKIRGSGRVYAVDTFAGTKEDDAHYPSVERFGGSTLTAFREQIARAEMSAVVHEVISLTTAAAKSYRGNPIRVLLIDADHSYAGVRSDFEAWWPFVAPGGLIIFHDYAMPSVARFVDETRGVHSGIVDSPGLVEENVFAVTKAASAPVRRINPPVSSLQPASCER